MKALVLRLDSLLISFGSVMVDQHGFIDRFPGVALLCGLTANALGWAHKDADKLQRLQGRIRFAARWDVKPEKIVDYHTVDMGTSKDLSTSKMREPGWTMRGKPEHRRGGGDAKYGIHQRYRHYWADGLMTVVMGLTEEGEPDIEDVRAAFRHPARPLFLGRKTCLPSRPLLDPCIPSINLNERETLLDALNRVPVWDRFGKPVLTAEPIEACWPAEIGTGGSNTARYARVYDSRDWTNQVMTGSRLRIEGIAGGESM